jgi:RHS repeat-associated protein
MQTDKLFTGQRQITGLGIYFFNARFYSPKLGRFLSADSIVPGYANPQNLNRMSYANNNSLRYTDLTGHRACDDVDAAENCITAPGGGGMGFGGVAAPVKPRTGGAGAGGTPTPTVMPIPSSTPIPTSTAIPTPLSTMTSTGTAPASFTQNSPTPTHSGGENGPHWGHIAEGIGIILAVDVLIVAPIVVGVIVTSPEVEVLMLLDVPWEMVMVSTVVAVNIYGLNLIVEGAQGR